MHVKIDNDLIKLIQDELHSNNQLYQKYKSNGQKLNNDMVMVIKDDYQKLLIETKAKNSKEIKQYSKPSKNDFGVCYSTKEDEDLSYSRDIVIHKNDNKLIRIDESHPAIDFLGYPLLLLAVI